ncbi:hypothetical protein [Nocardia pseudobrasiliensis]|uniref:Uncharacterized protein n=1 Tax=Nocardia pseudobrasiliensis TaxID=45979 RepID=A0A370HXU8_9NOCA|nr:hypothetical protein [Nocardia pseudobrasiliensis]RDI63338.1 hypothetical protein DFR76_11035 [Nocardia pseudobrasiliensis]
MAVGFAVVVDGGALLVGARVTVGPTVAVAVAFFGVVTAASQWGVVETRGVDRDGVAVVALGRDVVDCAGGPVVVAPGAGTITVTVVTPGSGIGFTSGRAVSCAEKLALALTLMLIEKLGRDIAVSGVALGALVVVVSVAGIGSAGMSPLAGTASSALSPTGTGSPASIGTGISRGVSGSPARS